MFKQEKGVTLVALVITIIVLLILAGVSISMVAGDNGVLTRASKSSKKTKYGAAVEAVNLACADLQSGYADAMAEGKASSADIPSYYTVKAMKESLASQGYAIASAAKTGEGDSAKFTVGEILSDTATGTPPVAPQIKATTADDTTVTYYAVYPTNATKDYIIVDFVQKSMGYSANYQNTLGGEKLD